MQASVTLCPYVRVAGGPGCCLPSRRKLSSITPTTLTYGQSVTDACMDIGTTAAVLDGLAAAVRSRRHAF